MDYDFTLPYQLANDINVNNKLNLSQEVLVLLIEAFQAVGSNKQMLRTADTFRGLSREILLERLEKISALSKMLGRVKLRSRDT